MSTEETAPYGRGPAKPAAETEADTERRRGRQDQEEDQDAAHSLDPSCAVTWKIHS